MRAQINLLKEMLDKQSIVNNHLLQQSMKTKVSQIHRQGWKTVACGIVAIVLNTLLYFVGALSLPVFINFKQLLYKNFLYFASRRIWENLCNLHKNQHFHSKNEKKPPFWAVSLNFLAFVWRLG